MNLEHRVVTSVDGTARPDEGTALDGTATWTTQLRGLAGAFGYVRTSRNAAFLRISLNGSLTARVNANSRLTGNWTETTIRTAEDDAGNRFPVTETRNGTCSGNRTGRVNLSAGFRRRGGAYRFVLASPRTFPTCPNARSRLEAATPRP